MASGIGTWHYGVVEYKNGELGLHEIYCNADGSVRARSENPIAVSDTVSGLGGVLLMMMDDAKKWPVIPDDFPGLD